MEPEPARFADEDADLPPAPPPPHSVEDGDRELPHSYEAERGVIGGVILDNRQWGPVASIVSATDFNKPRHRIVFRAMAGLTADGIPIDLITLRDRLADRGEIEGAGGMEYVASVTNGTARSGNVAHYAKIVREKHARREFMRAGEIAGNGATVDELAQAFEYAKAILDGATTVDLGNATNLFDSSIVGKKPEFDIADLVRRSGLHLVWAQPSGGKTWTLLRWCHEMMLAPQAQRSKLSGHPGLSINRRWKRVLYIATEEDAAALRYKADWIMRGLDVDALDGTLLYRFAADPKRRLTLDDLEEIIAIDGPLDAIVLDSLTGLRPKTVNGQAVRWDLDNDAANEMCLRLRGLTTTHQIAMLLCHHTGRDTKKGYRGPTDWWASADVMLGLIPDGGRTKVMVEKNRDGKRISPFYLTPSWEGDAYTLEYDGGAAAAKLTPTAVKVLAWMQAKGQASQAEIIAAKLAARSSIIDAITLLESSGCIADTGNKVGKSAIYRFIDESSDTVRESSGDAGERGSDE